MRARCDRGSSGPHRGAGQGGLARVSAHGRRLGRRPHRLEDAALEHSDANVFPSGLAFHTVPTNAYAANSAWRQLVALAHNLLTNFQIDTGAEQRAPSRKHTVLHLLHTVQTLRFEVFHRAAVFVRPGGILRLRLMENAATRRTFTRIANAVARAA